MLIGVSALPERMEVLVEAEVLKRMDHLKFVSCSRPPSLFYSMFDKHKKHRQV